MLILISMIKWGTIVTQVVVLLCKSIRLVVVVVVVVVVADGEEGQLCSSKQNTQILCSLASSLFST